MLTLLSPAKKLDFDPARTALPPTQPLLLSDVKELAKTAKKQSAADLKKLMHISDNLAELNAERFQTFNLDGQSNSQKPAMLAFNGDVYGGLDAASLSDDELTYAQDHVRILSGLYGVLRPMDSIQPYRLEMGTRMKNTRGNSLYEFWGASLANILDDELKAHTDGTIVNLASNEYFKAVDKSALNAPVIEAKFLNIKDGEARALMYYAKRARGLMARWIVQNRIDKTTDLKGFDLEGYTLDSATSSDTELVFTRPQPPKKS